MRRERRLSHLLLLRVTLAVAASTLSIGYFWIHSESKSLHTMADDLRDRMMDQRKNDLRHIVDGAVAYVQHTRNQTEQRALDEVRKQTYQAHRTATHLYETYRDTLPLSQIQALVRETLRSIRFNSGRGSYFANAMDGTQQLFTARPELEGKNLYDLRDTRGKYIVRDMIGLCRTGGEGFYQYVRSKPEAPGENLREVSFVKHFEPFDWLIGTCECFDDLEAKTQEEVLGWLSSIRLPGPPPDSYIFVGRYDGILLTHPAKGQNVLELDRENGTTTARDLIRTAQQGGGFVEYTRLQPDSRQGFTKLSYVREIEGWQWYVGTGRALDDIEAAYQATIAERRQRKDSGLAVTISGTAVAVLGALFLAVWSVRQTRREIDTFADFFHSAKSSDAPLPEERLKFREFRQLATATNEMIVERSRIQERLAASEQRMELALESAEIGLWDWDMVSNRAFFSPTYFTMLGYRPGDFEGSFDSWRDLLHPEDRDPTVRQVREALASGTKAWSIQFRLQHKDGSYRWCLGRGKVVAVDHDGRPLRATGTHVDITEAQEAKQALEISERKYRDLFENFVDVSYRTDAAGYLQSVSPSVERLLGFTPGELLGQRPDTYHRDSGRRDDFARQLRAHGEVTNFESEIRRKDGSYIWVSANARNLYDRDGRYAGVDGVMRDITELKRVRDAAKTLEQQLMQAQKMEAVGTLAGGIAHDFNNILTAILGFGELTLAQVEPGTQKHHYVSEIVSAAERARELVKQILTFSRRGEQERAPVKPALVVNEAMKLLEASIPKTIEIRKSIDVQAGTVFADATQLHQVVMNLCTNAYHAMREAGGIMEVALENVLVAPDLASRVADLRPGPYVLLSVSDNGPGMSPGTLMRAFDPFFTTKRVGEGTGMGLSVVHGIVKSHGGALDLSSSLGTGTQIRVYFPRYTGESATAPPSEPEEIPRGHGERILVVDDEPAIIDIVQLTLSDLGYRVDSEDNPERALQRFQEQPDEFDTVITDQTMPGLTGADILRAIRTIRPNLPVLICTGYSDTLDEAKAVRLGAKAMLTKPITRAQLAKAVHTALQDTRRNGPKAEHG